MKTTDETDLRMSQNFLRILIGVLGLLLPVLLVAATWALPQTSVSDYYYTNGRDLLEGALFFLAVFLMAYRPYGQDGWTDDKVTTLTGICALLIALFPTVNHSLGHVPAKLLIPFIPVDWSGTIHNCGAGGLFTLFAVLSVFFFTRGKKETRTRRKTVRNSIYVVCGLGIAACIGTIGVESVLAGTQQGRDLLDIFWPEAVALVLFGFSWLVKGGAILPDQR